MNFKKSLWSTAAIALTATTLLTGCGASGTATSGSEGGVTNLTWYVIGSPQRDTATVQEKINEYTSEKIGVTVDIKSVDFGDYNQKMQVVSSSGEPYDLAFTAAWANDYLVNARKGAFLPIDDYLTTTEGQELYETIDARFWEGAKIGGETYGVPTQKEISAAPMWVFTKEYVEKYDIPYEDIHTLQDLEPWLQLIKDNEPGVTPLYVSRDFSTPSSFDLLLEPLGVALNSEGELKVENIFETPEKVQALETMRDWYQKGLINSDGATAGDDKSIKRFVTKGDGQPYADVIWSKDLGYEVVTSEIMQPVITNASTTGSLTAISATSEHPEEAFKFLHLLNTDEYLRNLVNYGIEGTHYEKVNETQIKLLPEQKNYSMPYFALGNMFNTYTLENEPVTKWEEFVEFNNSGITSPALGFKFDPTPVQTEVAAFRNVLDEFGAPLNTGTVDTTDYLKKLNDKLKSSGIDKVKEEMQRQLDEWVAENK
ncbi:MAG: ABC transporter substrate-binding protein [Culicoidibacterales bacterium]